MLPAQLQLISIHLRHLSSVSDTVHHRPFDLCSGRRASEASSRSGPTRRATVEKQLQHPECLTGGKSGIPTLPSCSWRFLLRPFTRHIMSRVSCEGGGPPELLRLSQTPDRGNWFRIRTESPHGPHESAPKPRPKQRKWMAPWWLSAAYLTSPSPST